MISFLIPTYNYDCTTLVRDLQQQAIRFKAATGNAFDFEIIVSDDASSDTATWRKNGIINNWEGCRFIRQAENGGRARNLNALVEAARFEHVAIIDCDAAVCDEHFIRRYYEATHAADIVCGSLRNPPGPPPCGHELRYRYEQHGERHRSVRNRSKQPFARFCTFNVMIKKSVFGKVRFDERCTEYGYEDVLLGLELEKAGFSILHIDNPLVHTGIDDNASFLSKTETALRVLRRLGMPIQSHVGASRAARLLKRLGLLPSAAFLFHAFRRPLRKNLLGRRPSLLLFAFYKLGYYCDLSQKA